MNAKTILLILAIVQQCFAPPVTKEKEPEQEGGTAEAEENGLDNYVEYHRYLKEVVHALESDPEFRQKLEKAEEADIRTGKIANELEFVSHHVRTRLDEIKRRELARLRALKEQQMQMADGNTLEDPNHRHLDHVNPHTFEVDDLKKLIAKSTYDLAEADRKRKEEFKHYEMQKEVEKRTQLNETAEGEREKLEKHYKEMEEKHKKHEPLHEPGHKKQLEEVWEEQDHMDQEFNPKTFFMIHDLDGNGLWDQDEVKALFIKELDKMYSNGAPEDDLRERAEEMERMRESVFAEMDLNHDGMIDYYEFEKQTKQQKFEEDRGWKGLDEQKPYTDEELQHYIQQEQMRQQQMYYQRQQQFQQQQQQHQQLHPPQYQQQYNQQGSAHQQQPPQYQANQQHPPQYQQNQQHPPQYQQNAQHPPQYQQNAQHPPQYQQNAQHPPQYQQNQPQPPPYQQNHEQPPPYQQHAQPPPAYQQHPEQPPKHQQHPNEIPQGYANQAPAQQSQTAAHGTNEKHPELNTGEVHPPKVQDFQKQPIPSEHESKPFVQQH